MSGYPLKTAYDATQKRKRYLEELALRARLDEENLQANKLYKRTGAISTPPDTRTTTEKLSDSYRLKIEIRSKLGQLMSGDDAQKVVNRLDQQELVFLAGRIDKYISELKPKYSLGMPYQVFMKYFKDAVSNFMAYGDIDLNTQALFENLAKTQELQLAIENMTNQFQIAGKKDLILKIEGLDDFYNTINQARYILPNVGDATLQQNIKNSILAIENAVPTALELDTLRIEYENAVKTNSISEQVVLETQLQNVIQQISNIEPEKEALKQNLQQLQQNLPQQALNKISGQPKYYDDFIPISDNTYYTINQSNDIFKKIINVYNNSTPDKKQEFESWVDSQSVYDTMRSKQNPIPYVKRVIDEGKKAGVSGIEYFNIFLQNEKDFLNNFMIEKLPTPLSSSSSSVQSTPSSSSSSSSSSQSTQSSSSSSSLSSGQFGFPIPLGNPSRGGTQPGSQTGSQTGSQQGSQTGFFQFPFSDVSIPSVPSTSGRSINGTNNIRTGIQSNVNQSGSQSGSNKSSIISSLSTSGNITPNVFDDFNDKLSLLEQSLRIKGISYDDIIMEASKNDAGLSNVNDLNDGIQRVIRNTDIIDVDDLSDKIVLFLNDIIQGNWNTGRGQFDAYLKLNMRKTTPSLTPKSQMSRASSASSLFSADSNFKANPSVNSTPLSRTSSVSSEEPHFKVKYSNRIPSPPSFNYLDALQNYKNIYKYRENIQKELEKVSSEYSSNLVSLFNGVTGVNLNELDGMDLMINMYISNNQNLFNSIEEIGDFINSYLKLFFLDVKQRNIPSTISEFAITSLDKIKQKSGGSLCSKKMKRMKGGSVRIDVNAGMPLQTETEKPINYVPFGRYIINRNKLNDGVVMIKRPNGAFMGDLQSRRVSNNLRNIFQKVVGGNVPNFQDFSKLDNDEIEYLHYVAKKTNLLDKLQVPTPNKDTEEKMVSRYEVLRGQIIAGNDNKELIKEFKKLLLDMSDKKLLPRRQVSDILIDIEKMYG